jgi:hypothetical protein
MTYSGNVYDANELLRWDPAALKGRELRENGVNAVEMSSTCSICSPASAGRPEHSTLTNFMIRTNSRLVYQMFHHIPDLSLIQDRVFHVLVLTVHSKYVLEGTGKRILKPQSHTVQLPIDIKSFKKSNIMMQKIRIDQRHRYTGPGILLTDPSAPTKEDVSTEQIASTKPSTPAEQNASTEQITSIESPVSTEHIASIEHNASTEQNASIKHDASTEQNASIKHDASTEQNASIKHDASTERNALTERRKRQQKYKGNRLTEGFYVSVERVRPALHNEQPATPRGETVLGITVPQPDQDHIWDSE